MKSVHLLYAFCGVVITLALSEPSRSEDDGYVTVNEIGNAVAPTPKLRRREKAALRPVRDPAAAPLPNPNPLPPTHYTRSRESDEVRAAKREQKAKDAQLKADMKARMREVNALRLKNGQKPMASTSCKDGTCKFNYKEDGVKISCTGTVDSFLLDDSPGFNCGGNTCFLNADTGKMSCANPVAEPIAQNNGQPFAQPIRNPAGHQLPGQAPCLLDPERGNHYCPPQDNIRDGNPRHSVVDEAI